MGLVYETSKWLDRLWSEHLGLSSPARELVRQGVAKQGRPFGGFAVDLVARLYLRAEPAEHAAAPDWALNLHRQATELGEWQQLRLMCARNGFAAGIAAEAMLEQLLPHVPNRPEAPCGTSEPTSDPASGEAPTQESGGRHDSGASQGSSGPKVDPPGPNEAELRAAIRRAARTARDAVNNAEAGLEGVSTSLGFSSSGTATIRNAGPANLTAIREAHSRLSSSKRLRRIAEIAGRLERVAATKARSRVRPGIGEVHGVGLGSDFSRLLPSELVGLRHPRLQLATLARLVENRSLLYSMQGREPAGRGPLG